MKKTLLIAAVFAGAALVSAQDVSVSGYLRTGVEAFSKGENFKTNSDADGDYFGYSGGSKLQLNVDWTKDFGGASVRYQKAGSFADSDWFDAGNVKYAFAYANFFDSKIIVEGGKLKDRFTTTGGWEDGTFGDGLGAGNGARLVLNPVEGLYIAGSISDIFADSYVATDSKVTDGDAKDGDIKFNHDLFGISAKYSTDTFFVTAGAHAAKVYYGSIGFTGVKGLFASLEAFADYRDYSYKTEGETTTKTELDGNATNNVFLVPFVQYTGIEKLTLGVFSYIWAADEKYYGTNKTYLAEVAPGVSYAVTDIVTLAVEANIWVPYSWDEDKYGEKLDSYATFIPSVWFNAGNAVVHVFGTISTDTDVKSHAAGACVKFTF